MKNKKGKMADIKTKLIEVLLDRERTVLLQRFRLYENF